MEDAIAIFQNRKAIARCRVYDLERERTAQAFLVRELRRDHNDAAAAEKRLSDIGYQLRLAREAVGDIEAVGVIKNSGVS